MTQPTRRKRRAPGEGSITKRKDGLWAGMLDLGWQDGRRKRKFVYARTRSEAARKLADASRDLREGRLIADERMTVEQYLRSWLEIIEPTIAARTHKRYGQLLRLHAYPYIGRLRLSKLEPSHLAQLYARRIKTGLSPTTVLQLHRVLHHSLKDGHRQGLAPRNVAELVTPPVKAEHEFITLSPKQARHFLEIVEGNRLHALYVVALTTGMREGELLGLRWADVDLDAGAFHVTRRLKRRTSRRQVLLVAIAIQALKLHRERQEQERRRAGSTWAGEDLVFPNTVGRPVNPSNFLRREFYPLLEAAGLPRMRFHDLRHSAATLLLGMGVHPKIVSEMLGHTQIGITLDLYSHVTATMQRDAVQAFEELLGSSQGSSGGSEQDQEPQSTS
jgi:integrase